MPQPRYLCAHAASPGDAPDPVAIECALETGRHAEEGLEALPRRFKVVAYNLERGLELAGQLAFLREDPAVADLDLLLVSEADRGCSRVGGRDVTRELAEGLGLDFAFAVQYVELPRRATRPANRVDATCEHGNALLARAPLLGARQLRHERTARWDQRADEPRLGGCVSVAAELELSAGGRLRSYSVHFDSGWTQDDLRQAQAEDLIADASQHPGPVLIAGDMNTFRYTADVTLGTRLDPTARALAGAGYTDAHAGHVPRWRRGTTSRRYGVRGVIDLIWTRGLRVVEAGVARRARGLSDHLPVWAVLEAL